MTETRLSGCAPQWVERAALQSANKLNIEQRELTLCCESDRVARPVEIGEANELTWRHVERLGKEDLEVLISK